MALIYCKFNEVKRLLLIFADKIVAIKIVAIKRFLKKRCAGTFMACLFKKTQKNCFFYILTYIFIVGKLLLEEYGKRKRYKISHFGKN